MNADFFRFPHTPHLQWLGENEPRQDKVLSSSDAKQLLQAELTIEEKVDGANVGFSVGADGRLRAQNRGAWIEKDTKGQFKHLWRWARRYEPELIGLLGSNLILFGEWCYARHSIAYQSLPDWFIGFDIYDRLADRFYSIQKRNECCQLLGVNIIRPLATGCFSINNLIEKLDTASNYGAKNVEGIYLRHDNGDWLEQRAKLVRSNFTQNIGSHWSKRGIQPNQISGYQ